jgi:hypothetical protein
MRAAQQSAHPSLEVKLQVQFSSLHCKSRSSLIINIADLPALVIVNVYFLSEKYTLVCTVANGKVHWGACSGSGPRPKG